MLNAGAEPGSGLILMQKPFDEQERIDEDSLRSAVDFVIDAGVHGVGPT